MESLVLSFNAIAPIFILIILGYFLKKIKVGDQKSFDTMNKIVFKLFLPVLLFYNIYKTEKGDVFDAKLIAFLVLGVIAVFAIGYICAMIFTKENSRRGVMIQGFFRSNRAIFGMPIVGYICGEGSGALTALAIAVVIPVFNVLAVTALERFRGAEGKVNLGKLFMGIIKNPLIIGCLIGLVFFLLGIKLPTALEKSVKDVSSVATPLALIVLGSKFEFSAVRDCLKELVVTLGFRLIIIPLIMLAAAVWLGFTGEALACILITFGSPVATSSFAMAQQMGGDEQLAAQLVVMSSAFCLFTMFVWIFSLSYLGLF